MVCLPSTLWGSSMMRMGLVFAIMSMGLRLRKVSSFLSIMRWFLLELNACILMIMTLMALSDAKRSTSVKRSEL